MTANKGAADVGTLPFEWHDEQLQRVKAVFAGVDSATADEALRSRVLAELPDASEGLVTGIGVLRGLLHVEHEPERFRRLLRIWVGRVTVGVRERDYEAAGMWFRALTEAPVFAEEFAALVAETRRNLASEELLKELVNGLVLTGSPPSAAALLAAWGEPLVEYLVSQIVTDEPVVNRRHLVDLLGMAGRGDVRHLTARLADPRWFVVRNMATAVGKAGRLSALAALEAVAEHDDDRVRVEAVRAIAALKADDALPEMLKSVSDPSAKVRRAGISLLRACASDGVVSGVLQVLRDGVVGADDARRLVEVIAERRGPDVVPALEDLARRKLAIGASKAARDEAREALKKRSR